MCDIHAAISFCKDQDDSELWTKLIDYSMDKPYYINVLLNHIGTHVDPRMLIERIETGQEIPGLRASLVQIIHDYCLQLSLTEGTLRIVKSDLVGLQDRQVSAMVKAVPVDEETECAVCGMLMLQDGTEVSVPGIGTGVTEEAAAASARRRFADTVVFRCRHVYHVECMGESATACIRCQKVTW